MQGLMKAEGGAGTRRKALLPLPTRPHTKHRPTTGGMRRLVHRDNASNTESQKYF